MNWHSFADFVDMGGYALYVWGAYVMTGAALAWEALMLAQRRYRAIDELRELEMPALSQARGTRSP